MYLENSLVVQWLGLCTLTAQGPGSTPGQEAKILLKHGAQPKQEKEREKQDMNLNACRISSLYNDTLNFSCLHLGSLHFLKKSKEYSFFNHSLLKHRNQQGKDDISKTQHQGNFSPLYPRVFKLFQSNKLCLFFFLLNTSDEERENIYVLDQPFLS